ncbi:hypothetical protein [Thiosulfativibrio zosterae]|uniref:Uncharacterized protein n=1 Tax=Thiosulfativibrio zosterae TaxID=2675053 RepID=A0A6F8PR58_9GAMM|nr:hypothetical protein [Thiosulfativibrio zosterae]BBP44613.1 hypothetical protein THMIRHAT_23590 [Thiosulfativibrio zosterae]
MHLSYEKLGTDHPMYGKVEYIVMDEQTPVCYKTATGYLSLDASASPTQSGVSAADIETTPLYVLSFSINGDAEEMTFSSKAQLEKTKAAYEAKGFVKDIKTTVYQTVA